MAVVPNGAYALQVEGHEERILRLEDSIQTVVSTVAEIKVSQTYAAKRQDEQFSQIIDKLDESMEAISQRVYWTAGELEKGKVECLANKTKLEHLEEAEQVKKNRANNYKKIALPLLLGAVGFIGSKLGVLIWAWLTR